MAELLSTEEAAKVLDVTPGTLMVWRSVKRYPLKYLRIGRKVRSRQTDLDEFLALRTHTGLADPPRTKRRRKAA